MQNTDIAPPPIAYFDPGDGRRIAYRHRPAAEGLPTVFFLPGYASDMDGSKAVEIDRFCAAGSVGCLRIDYSGTGSSGGDFADGSLTKWLDEAISALDLLVEGPVIVVGSSMGGWLALHVAMKRADQVKAVLGIAAAPDFTHWGFSAEEKQALRDTGRLERPNLYGPEPMVTHGTFWESGATMGLLYSPIDVTQPVRLIHGEKDADVPMGVPIKLMEDLRSADVQLRLIKNGGHRLSEPHEIHAILVELVSLLEMTR